MIMILEKWFFNSKSKGAVTLHNFLSNLSCNTIEKQVARELHSVTGVVSVVNVFQCATLSTPLHKVEFKSMFCNELQLLVAPLHSVSTVQQLSLQFVTQVLYNRCQNLLFCSEKSWVWGVFSLSLSKILLRTISQCNRVQFCIQQLVLQAIVRQVAEKITQCNSTLNNFKLVNFGLNLCWSMDLPTPYSPHLQ